MPDMARAGLLFPEAAPKMLLLPRHADTPLSVVPVTQLDSPPPASAGACRTRGPQPAAAKAAGGCARPAAIARRTRRMTIRCGRRWKKSRGFPGISYRVSYGGFLIAGWHAHAAVCVGMLAGGANEHAQQTACPPRRAGLGMPPPQVPRYAAAAHGVTTFCMNGTMILVYSPRRGILISSLGREPGEQRARPISCFWSPGRATERRSVAPTGLPRGRREEGGLLRLVTQAPPRRGLRCAPTCGRG